MKDRIKNPEKIIYSEGYKIFIRENKINLTRFTLDLLLGSTV